MLAPRIRLKLQRTGCCFQQASPEHNCVQAEITASGTAVNLVVCAYKYYNWEADILVSASVMPGEDFVELVIDDSTPPIKEQRVALFDAIFYKLNATYASFVLNSAFRGHVMKTHTARYAF